MRAIGREFDVDAFLKGSPLDATAVFHRGEPRGPAATAGPQRSASGFSVAVSTGDTDDLSEQLGAATCFLAEHEDELRRLGSYPGVEEVCLDLALPRRNVTVQSELFPAELLWRAGALDIDLMVTHYAIADAES